MVLARVTGKYRGLSTPLRFGRDDVIMRLGKYFMVGMMVETAEGLGEVYEPIKRA
jgi:hypothetical protein